MSLGGHGNVAKRTNRVLLFTGDGKGKTTAALGMALRTMGHGEAALMISFIKADPATGELQAAVKIEGLTVRQVGRGFLPRRDDAPALAAHRAAAAQGLAEAATELAAGNYRLVILDEICTAVARGLIALEAVRQALTAAAAGTIIVLTGRDAPAGLLELADTVTEMKCVKHGYAAGYAAQAGVEF